MLNHKIHFPLRSDRVSRENIKFSREYYALVIQYFIPNCVILQGFPRHDSQIIEIAPKLFVYVIGKDIIELYVLLEPYILYKY